MKGVAHTCKEGYCEGDYADNALADMAGDRDGSGARQW